MHTIGKRSAPIGSPHSARSKLQSASWRVRGRINHILRTSNQPLLPPNWSVTDVSDDTEHAQAKAAFSVYELQKDRRPAGICLLVETTATGLVRAYLGTQCVKLPIKSEILPFGFEATPVQSFGLRSCRRLFNNLSERLEHWETIAVLGSLP